LTNPAIASEEGIMSKFIVHSHPGSPFGRSVMATLEEKGAPFRLARLAPKSPEHLALHPFGRIPIFEHDGFRLYETQAILRYLDRVLPTPALTPAEPKRAARMDQVMNINDWYLFQGVGNVIIFHRVVGPRVMGTAPDEDAIKAAMPKAHVVFDELARLLAQQPYFAGDTISLADLMISPALEFFTLTPEWSELGAPHANLVAWLARMQARPSMMATTWERLSAISEAA
jgi:glutathione S-transferase